VGGVSLKSGGRGPLERSAVGDASDNGRERLDVLSGTTEKDERNRVGGSWLPGDGESLASRDDLVRLLASQSQVSRRIPRFMAVMRRVFDGMEYIPRSKDE
jgi:hypothetical protein